MREQKDNLSFLQCQSCGHIYSTKRNYSIEDFYVGSYCPRCGYDMALNLGDKEEDIYLYYNSNLDERNYL